MMMMMMEEEEKEEKEEEGRINTVMIMEERRLSLKHCLSTPA